MTLRQERLHLSQALHDLGLGPVPRRKPEFGTRPTTTRSRKRSRVRPESWCEHFLRAFLRTGSLRHAAIVARVSPQTARNYISRHLSFRDRVQKIEGQYLLRMLHRLATGRESRLELSRSSAKALLTALAPAQHED